ncbi:FG-GAP-like repeat-containing protein [Streptomyces lunaelactis]|uniref:FG-GAP-like repeat-containing protein n=1 Tax=Streptomyces lunaelactis TaxID=1535768 RepID=UPI0015846689|nr:FG-GAP-like repeat-containing protein [Streptomyces lunaelactis]NUK23443.1 VCBS repeat-containing protein [Streptomyces lunaelactis]
MALSVGMIAVSPQESSAAPSAESSSNGSSVTLAEKQRKEATAAEKRAKKTGKPVEIVSERTETDETYANPDGTFTVDRYLLPQRVRQGGRLVSADPHLVVHESGRITPRAAGITVSFSGGGDGAFATMAKEGREVVLSWPGKLPKPTLADATATYPEVLPGVDLTATAAVGSFSHALVVKNAQAAKNPKLAEIIFGLKAKGLDLKTGANGEIRALDPTGQSVFSAPKPRMWDSAGSESLKRPDVKAKSTPAARPLAEALDGATEGSRQAELGVKLTDRSLTLKPDRKLLTDPKAVFPIVIDPVWAKDAWKNAWSIAYKHTAYANSDDTVYYNGGTISDFARVGVANDPEGGVVRANTYFRIATGNVWNKQILKSTLRIKQTHAGSWSCKSGDVLVKDIGKALPANITWNRQPAWLSTVDASGESFGGRNCPADSAGLVEFDVTSAISKAAKGKYPAWAFALTARNSTVDVSWRKFDPNSARISTYLNTPPDKPQNLSTNPSVPCAGGAFGTTDYVTLRAKVNDAEDNNLKVQFQYALVGATTPPVRPAKIDRSRGTVADLRIDSKNLVSGTYWWNVVVDDGTARSPVSDTCKFTLDKDRPSAMPGVSSQEFPADRDGGRVGTTGYFNFTAGGVADVKRYEWWTDSDTTVRSVDATVPGGPSKDPQPFKPLSAGPDYLYVQSIDGAGNRSEPLNYLFYPTRKPERDKPGDLNGDGTVDLWTVDPGSQVLWMHPGQGNGKFGLGRMADQASFGEAGLTHRGSWEQDGDYDEDLVALRPGAEDPAVKELWVYGNRGNGELGRTDTERYELKVASAEDNHWRNADQILAIGSMNNDSEDADTDGAPIVNESDTPDLLVKSGGELWLYLGAQGNDFLDNFDGPFLLGNADWQDMTLLAPGDLNKDGLPEIWARDINTGKIHQYTSRRTSVAGDATVADLSVYADPAARTTAIGSGFTGAAYPHLATEGDFEGDGFADLWSRDGTGVSVEFPGRTLTDGSAFGAARPLVTGGTPWSQCDSYESAATGKHTLCGPILAKYKALGGPAKFGYPSRDVVTAPDKIGRYTHFHAPGTKVENRSIYWSPDTGAWSVVGDLWTKWTAMGREGGTLGYPTADERHTSDGVGWVITFSKVGKAGAIYRAPETGTFATQGNIYAKYRALGGPAALGFPTTDVRSTGTKPGNFQKFRFRNQTADSGGIWWSSTTGAWSVRNDNYTKWAALAYENSSLGFPTSDEYPVTGGLRSDFENGYIRWNRTSDIATEHEPADSTGGLRTELMGDVNGDGRSDMIVAYNYEGASTGIHVLTANAEGGFNPPREAWTSSKGGFDHTRSKWVAGDFNADGRSDVAAFYGYADGSVATSSFFGQTDGTFSGAVKSAILSPGTWKWGGSQVRSGDFNGDKRTDMAVLYDLGNATSALYTFTAKADGTFNAPFVSWKSSAGGWDHSKSQMVAGDFNGDGRDELMALYVYDDDSEALWRFNTSPTGSFTSGGKVWDSGSEPRWGRGKIQLASGDFNGDKRTDIAVLYSFAVFMQIDTYTANPDGGFDAPRSNWQSPLWSDRWEKGTAGNFISGDANGDGVDDVATMLEANSGSSRAYTFVGRSDGDFDTPQPSWHAEPGTW